MASLAQDRVTVRHGAVVRGGASGQLKWEVIVIGVFVRALLAVGGIAAAWFVGRGAPNFLVVQGMLALVIAVLAAVLVPAATWARAAWYGRGGHAAPTWKGRPWAP